MKDSIIAGFAIFAMFFGSGNLVFPLVTGYKTGTAWGDGVLGFGLTGVLLPALGLFVTTLWGGKVNEVFRPLTKPGAILLSLVLLSILGPLGVVPRCIIVAYGSFCSFSSSFPLWLFSLLWCGALYGMIPKREKIIPVIGRYLTPLKLATLLWIVGGSIGAAPPISPGGGATQGFLVGMGEGNHTMDLMASFFFAMSVMGYFKRLPSENSLSVWKKSLAANLVGMALLLVMYISFIYLGASYQPYLVFVPPEQMLPTIAHQALGTSSQYWISFTILVSCFTTSVALMGVFCDYMGDLLEGKGILGSYSSLLKIGIAICFGVSLVGFQKIGGFLTPILQILYPFIVIFTIGRLIFYFFRRPNL